MAAILVAGVVGWAGTAQADSPLPRGTPEEVGLSAERLARIAAFARAEIDAGQMGGYGTCWWADPEEQLVAVWMAPTPVAATQLRYRHTLDALVNQGVVD